LNREQIVRVALDIADRDGLEALTMRRLAKALARSPMALYYYVSDRDDLLKGIAELLNDEVEPPSALDWSGYAEQCAWGLFRLATAHPKVVPSIVASTSLVGPSPIVPHIGGVVERLIVAGLSEEAAELAVVTLWDFATGAIIAQLVGRPTLGIASPDPEAEFRLGIEIVLSGMAARLFAGHAARSGD
jgi:AcrR family transcriptional regulator